MNKKMIVLVLGGIIIIGGGISVYLNTKNASAPQSGVSTKASNGVTASTTGPMLSTGVPFTQYQYFNKSHQVFPTLATDTTKALGAFGYTKESLGNNIYKITLTNKAEGYKGQSVTVSGDQSVYFIERSTGDDSDTEDSVTTDDILVAVDAQGNMLK